MHSRQAADARMPAEAGIHSYRRAADALGVEDPEGEFARWLEEAGQLRTTQVASTTVPNGALKAAD